MRAFLFARATAAIFGLRRPATRANHPSARSGRRLRLSSTERAPWISNVRKYVSPRLLMPSRFVLPPEEFWRGTSPSHAANWRLL